MANWGIDREELAWCAGFFDGEGNVGAYDRKKGDYIQPRLILQIAQTDSFVLERFAKAVGVGNLTGPYKPKTLKSSVYWCYRIEGMNNVQHVVALMWNWLSPQKQGDAIVAMNRARAWMARTECQKGHGVKLMTNGSTYCPTCRSESAKKSRARVVI